MKLKQKVARPRGKYPWTEHYQDMAEGLEAESKRKKPRIVFKHYRFVDPIWRAQQLEAVLDKVVGVMASSVESEEEEDALFDLTAETYGLGDLTVLLNAQAREVEDEDGEAHLKLFPVGPFPYSRGDHLLPDGETKERNTWWKPDPVGGETVAAILLDGVSFCVIEPCVPPDAYRYERGRTIAEGRLRAGLAEMGIELPK